MSSRVFPVKSKVPDKGQRLRLFNITAKQNGVYSCRAENPAGTVESSNNFIINVKEPGFPHLIEDQFTPYQLALKHQAASLKCPFEDADRIEWFTQNSKVENKTDRQTVYPNGTLLFHRVLGSDEETYRCESYGVQNSKSQAFTVELILSDLDPITSLSFEPRLRSNFPIVIPVKQDFEIKVFPPTGRPSPDYRWLDPKNRIVGTTGHIRVKDETTLVFDKAQDGDSGYYTFVANNTWGEKRKKVNIVVSLPPILNWVKKPRPVQEDGRAELECKVTGSDYPVTTILWTKDGMPLSTRSTLHRMDLENGTLIIPRVRAEDEGKYACVANATGHPIEMSSKAFLRVIRKLKFNPPLDKVYNLILSQPARIVCNAEASREPKIKWFRKGSSQLPIGMHEDRGVLTIDLVDWSDAGPYVCVANHNDQIMNATTLFRVVEPPKFRIRPDNNTTVYEGQRAMIHCVSLGEPRPLITWDKDGRVIGTSKKSQQQELQESKEKPQSQQSADGEKDRHHVFPNGTLLLRKVLIEDRGRYGCAAENTAGLVRADFNLVITKPSDHEDSFDVAKTVVIVVCIAAAYLALVIGLMAFCSYRLLAQRKNRKQLGTANGKHTKFGRQGGANGGGGGDFGSNSVHQNPHLREQHELLMKDRDSGCGAGGGAGGASGMGNGTGAGSGAGIVGGLGIYQLQQSRSDSDNRSHASGMSSHPSHSSTSASGSGLVSGGGGVASAGGAGGITAAAFRARSASLDRFHFPRQDLQTLGIIGKGQFGDVFLAKARAIRPMEGETLVVVKSLLTKSEAAMAEFYAELEMYGKLEHPNVARLLGVCREMEPVFMVTEYCDWGDLKQFLLATRTDSGRRLMGGMGMGGAGGAGVGGPRVPPLSAMQRLKMCQQVALGMEYLAGYRMVHRDLAARNVMLSSRMDLKVCSLSLSRDVYANEYFNHPAQPGHRIPLRWLPPEAVRDAEYSFPSDIWSYGVFMWEVFHLCDLPYRLHGDEDIYKAMCATTGSGAAALISSSSSGAGSIPRLDFAEHCPHQVVDIVVQCCATNSAVRPTFSDLVVTLGHLLTNGDCV
ncbi:hypothetical protein RRG08_033521 [Elysia crispata]|uniref:receptor protein-tyrosine kinase n=1 Tax=Elysia crispata TaxID=231223 RepID=A0AAE0XP22_9GAST|nr:hypothetical protein RRG08_033521 [Elysia crispata]